MNKKIDNDILNIKSIFTNHLENNYTEKVKVSHDNQTHTVELKIGNCKDKRYLIEALEEFIHTFNENKNKEIIPSWHFDEENSIVQGPNRKFLLTPKESIFLSMLLRYNKIVTYSQMNKILWKNCETVSRNAIRVFTKNIKRKLPANILVNIQNIGYKLVYMPISS